jgi:radical SAM superfamily enzyme YgiQ (UPF0313 family)
MAHCDFACIGEGEEPLRQLYEHILNNDTSYSGIPNIAYRCDGHIKKNPVTYVVESLDTSPYPDYKFSNSYYLRGLRDGAKFERIPEEPCARGEFFSANSILFYSQRGCKLACTYCSNSLYHRLFRGSGVSWYRYASVDRVKRELRCHLKWLPFIKHISLNDDDLLGRSVSELEAIAAFLNHDLGVDFNINATPHHVTREKIEALAKHGLGQVAMGIQTGSNRILKNVYKRPVYRKDILAAAHILSEFSSRGVSANYGFILDNPYETCDDWRESLQLLFDLPKPKAFMLYSLAFFPGTVLAKRAIEDGYITCPELHCNKMYHDDIRISYQYFLFYLYTNFNVPAWLHSFLLSDIMLKYSITRPARAILAAFTLLPKIKTRAKKWLKRVAILMLPLCRKHTADQATLHKVLVGQK